MPLYELGMIIDPEASPDEETTTLERVETIISEAGGEMVNKDAWGKLDAKTQKLVMDAAAAAEKDVWGAMAATNEGYNKTMAENGMNVLAPSDALKADFLKIGETMSGEWAKAAGDRGKKIIDAYNN